MSDTETKIPPAAPTDTPDPARDRSETPALVSEAVLADFAERLEAIERDRSETPGKVIDKAIGGVDVLVQTRAIHFHPGATDDPEGVGCYSGQVTQVQLDGKHFSAVVWPHGLHDAIPATGAAPGASVMLTGLQLAAPEVYPTAHLSRDCPWHR